MAHSGRSFSRSTAEAILKGVVLVLLLVVTHLLSDLRLREELYRRWRRVFADPSAPTGWSRAPPEALNAYAWAHRTQTTPLEYWYLNATRAGEPPAVAVHRLPAETYAEGRVLYPLHLAYLWVVASFMAVMHPLGMEALETGSRTMWDLFQPTRDHLWTALPHYAVTAGWLVSAVVVFVGTPAVWRLCEHALRHLTLAARARHASLVGTPAAGAETGGDAPLAPLFAAALVVHLVAVVPLVALEMATLYPVATCGVALLWCALLLLQDEESCSDAALLAEAGGALRPREELFDLERPVHAAGAVLFFPRRAEPGFARLTVALTLAVAAALTLPMYAPAVPVVLMWVLSACRRRSYRRVLVRVRNGDGADAPLTTVGLSGYTDRLLFGMAAGCATAPVSLFVAAVTTPFWYRSGTLFDFMHLLARPPPPPALFQGGVSGGAVAAVSPECYTPAGLMYFSCTRAEPNVWYQLEYWGAPLTRVLRGVLGVLDPAVPPARLLFALDYLAILMMVFATMVPLAALLFYRLSRPPSNVDTPALVRRVVAEKRAEIDAYFRKHTGPQRAQTRAEREAEQRRQAAAGADRPRTVAHLTSHEYVVKQLALLLWCLLAAFCAAVLFGARAYTPLAAAPLLVPAGALAGLHVVAGAVARRFRAALAAESADAAQRDKEALVLGAPVWRASGQRWFRAAATLSEPGDMAWLLAALYAVVATAAVPVLLFVVSPLAADRWCLGLLGLFALGAAAGGVWRRPVEAAGVVPLALLPCAQGLLAWRRLTRASLEPPTAADLAASAAGVSLSPVGREGVVAVMGDRALLATVLLLGLALYSNLRVLRMLLEREESRLLPVEQEMSLLAKTGKTEKKD